MKYLHRESGVIHVNDCATANERRREGDKGHLRVSVLEVSEQVVPRKLGNITYNADARRNDRKAEHHDKNLPIHTPDRVHPQGGEN